MKLNKSSISAALVAVSRWASAIFPEPGAVTGGEIRAIQQRCRKSHHRWGHCEFPFPVTWPLRRGVWADEVARINSEENDPIPFPIPPAPVPEEEQPDEPEEVPAAAKLINWELKDVYV